MSDTIQRSEVVSRDTMIERRSQFDPDNFSEKKIQMKLITTQMKQKSSKIVSGFLML
jgi:hypothetical protein